MRFYRRLFIKATRRIQFRLFPAYKRKKAILSDGLFTYLMSGSLWRASCPPPSGPLLRNVQIRSRRICPTQESAHRQTTDKTKGPVFRLSLLFLFDVWQFPTLAWGDPTLPSALRRFTSEFGMGSGGTTALQPPDKFFSKCRTLTEKLVLIPRVELGTSPLPRVRSTN